MQDVAKPGRLSVPLIGLWEGIREVPRRDQLSGCRDQPASRRRSL